MDKEIKLKETQERLFIQKERWNRFVNMVEAFRLIKRIASQKDMTIELVLEEIDGLIQYYGKDAKEHFEIFKEIKKEEQEIINELVMEYEYKLLIGL